MAGTAGLTDVDILMIQVANLTDAGGAVHADIADFAGGQTDLSQLAFLSHQLRGGTGRADQLCAVAGLQLHIVDHSTHRNVGDGQAVAGLDISGSGRDNLVAGLQAVGSQDIAQGLVLVLDESNESGAVGIVLNALHSSGHVQLLALEVDHAVLTLVAAAAMADGDVTIAVATCILLEALNQATLRFCLLVYAVESGNGHVSAGRGIRLKSINSHLRFSPLLRLVRPCLRRTRWSWSQRSG